MSLRTVLIVILFFTSSSYAGAEVRCRGSVFLSELGFDVNLSVLIDHDKEAIEVLDISNDLEEWVSFKPERFSIGNFRSLIKAKADGTYPHGIDASLYQVSYEVDDVLGLPEKLYNFSGKIGGVVIPPLDLSCVSE